MLSRDNSSTPTAAGGVRTSATRRLVDSCVQNWCGHSTEILAGSVNKNICRHFSVWLGLPHSMMAWFQSIWKREVREKGGRDGEREGESQVAEREGCVICSKIASEVMQCLLCHMRYVDFSSQTCSGWREGQDWWIMARFWKNTLDGNIVVIISDK